MGRGFKEKVIKIVKKIPKGKFDLKSNCSKGRMVNGLEGG